ncbi:hypothetical protein TorRG33x02_127520 [Trema orientale]|uniref:DUF674 domain-containing protein n=1 Tax=Trema orientale TaxID=63057 RepID=A0A2P5F126_TREOI|nr:hypothetical protein TorRG33x02_127520 [Trema orientale]
MSTSTDIKPSISLKLLVDTKGKRVLFAEVGKDFVDFLLSLMSLPIGTVIRLLSCEDMVGSLGKLYESFDKLSNAYIRPDVSRDTVLKPKGPIFDSTATLFSLPSNNAILGNQVYICGYCKRYATYNPKDSCSRCGHTMSTSIPVVKSEASSQKGSTSNGKGYVKEVVTYMVMDDLELKPMSTICGIALLNKFKIEDIGVLEEKDVSMGMAEGLKLLKASLESKTVLTNVFLRKESDIVTGPTFES